jgi:hypothetical protein
MWIHQVVIVTLQLGQVKEYNAQVRFGTWDVDVDLPYDVKNRVCKFSALPIYFKHFNYIVDYCVYLI